MTSTEERRGKEELEEGDSLKKKGKLWRVSEGDTEVREDNKHRRKERRLTGKEAEKSDG